MYLPSCSNGLRKGKDSLASGLSANEPFTVVYVKSSLNQSNKCGTVLFQLFALIFSKKTSFAKLSQFSDLQSL